MISICIPVRDGGPEFQDHLNCWMNQKCSEEFEIVVLDSGSQDSTVEIAQRLGANVHTIPAEQFNHGESRNRLAELARGDLLVFTVQDAYPVDSNTLRELTRPLREDGELVGVTGKQIPRPDADLMARWETHYHNRMFDKGVRKKRLPPADKFAQLDFNQQIEIISFDNVCSALRRTTWQQFPFARVDFGEDLEWSYRVMKSGNPILHNPCARVCHSHNYSPWLRFKRCFVGRYNMNRLLAVSPHSFLWSEEEAFAALAKFRHRVRNLRADLRQCSGELTQLRVSRSVPYLFLRALDKWGPKALRPSSLRPLRRFAVEWLSRYFNYVCRQVLKYYRTLSVKDSLYLVDHAEAQVAGDFLAQCYYRCDRLNGVSEEFASLARLLRKYY